MRPADGTTRIRDMKRVRTAPALAALVAIAAGAAAQPAPPRPPQRRPRLRRRPRVRRHRRLRRAAHPHAAHRPAGRRGRALHRLLRGAGRLLGVARGAPHRRLPEPRRHPGRALAHLDDRHRRGRDDARRGAEGPRLRDGDLRQVAPRAPAALSPDAPRLRRLPRPPLLERHVAEPPGEDEVPAAAALLRGRRPHAQPRPVAADRRVRPARRGLHRGEPRAPLLRLRRPHDAARADLRVRGASAGARSRASTAT